MIVRRSAALLASSFVLVGALALPSTASAAVSAGEHPFHGVTFIVGCKGEQTTNAPKALDLDCKLGLRDLTGLKWKNWGAASATATGTFELTVNGRLSKYPVKVVASKLAKRPDNQVYTSVTYTFTGKMPKGFKRANTVKFAVE